MSRRKTFLISFGATIGILNTIFYLSLRDIAKFHGYIQLSLAVLGFVMLVIGISGPQKEESKP